MKNLYLFLFVFYSIHGFSQDVSMQNGTFNRCEPNRFFDSGGGSGNYTSNENLITTICAENAGEFVKLVFTSFSTELNFDILTIYDGADTSAPVIGSYSGGSTQSPGTVQASPSNSSGCLTFQFVTDPDGTGSGFAADIFCAVPCQTIDASIDSTNPVANGVGVVEVQPGDSITFNGSASFSSDENGATYEWDFDDATIVEGTSVTHSFENPGTYIVTFTATDTNPLECSGSDTITVVVLDNNTCAGSLPICSGIENVPSPIGSGQAEAGINYDCLTSQPRPRWYFLQTGDVAGNLDFTLTQYTGQNETGSGIDVDFIVWGPFSEPVCGPANLNSSTQVDCSFSAAAIENINIPNAPANSFYVLLITNYSSSAGFINLELNPTSTATTNCDIICQVNLGDDQTICNGEEYTITMTGNGTFNNFEWLLDGEVIPDETNPSITVSTPGTYTLIANGVDAIFGDPCETQDEVVISVIQEDASFTITPSCDGATVTVTGDSGGSFAFNPDPADGASINPDTGEVINALPNITYFIEYTTSGTCPTSSIQELFINSIDDATFTLTPTCDGATATVSGDSGGTFAFNPAPGDAAFIDSITGTVTGGESGVSYTVEYTTSGACPSISTQTFTVLPSDDASFTMTPTCDGGTSSISGTAGGTFTFNPMPSDTAVIDANTGTVTGGTPLETYTIEYTTSGTCPLSSFQNVTVLDEDDATFTLTPTCDGGTVTLSGTTGGTFTFQPIPSDGAVIDTVTGEVTGGTPGASYTILYVTSGVCPDSSTQVLNVLPVDNSGFTMTPTCDGATATITGVVGGTFAFNPAPTDSAVIDMVTGTVTDAIPDMTYTVEYTTNGSCPSSSLVTFTVNPLPIVNAPTPLAVCDDNVPDGLTPIDLTVKDNEITGGNPQSAVSYHLTQADADSDTGALASPYTNTANPQTLYVRVENTSTGCYDTTALDLQVEQAPVAFTPDPLEYCDPDSDGFGVFTLTDADAEVTGGASGLEVSYHETLAEAENNVNALASPYDNIVAFTQTLYVRVVSSILTTDCATIVALELNVLTTPEVPLDLEDYVICDTNGDGFVQFDLTTKDAEILGDQGPLDYTLTYHTSQGDADSGSGAIVNVNSYTNATNPQTIYVRLEGANGCWKTGEFEIRADLPPTIVQPTPLNLCDDDLDDGMTAFDLTVKDGEITAGDGSLFVNYYTSSADAQADANAIDPATSYVNMSVNGNPANPQTLFVRVTDGDTGCTAFTTLTIRVLPNPTPNYDPSDLVLCDDTNTGDGVEMFDLTENQSYILNGEGGVTPTYHETPEDAEAGTGAIADPAMYANTNTDNTAQTIYVRVTNSTTGCHVVVDFDIRVDPLPDVVAVSDYILCEVNTDGFAQFDLAGKDAEVLNGQDPLLFSVTYHAAQADADNLVNALSSPYTNTSNPQQIFVAITNVDTGCSISTASFNIEVDNGAQANADTAPIVQVVCDEIGGNDGLAQFDLAQNNSEVLDGQDPADFTVSYYLTGADAELGVNPIPDIYENISNPQVIYVRVDNDETDAAGMDASICYAVAQLTLRVDLLPIFDLEDSYTLCVDTNGTEVIGPPILDTGLSAGDHTFLWSLDGTELTGETGPFLIAAQGGTYSVEVTNATTGCVNTDSAGVIVSSPPTVTVEVVTQAFADNGVIVATAIGEGIYEYSLDNGPWQESGTFEGVSFGEHVVTARDINGCGEASDSETLLNYPQFFTPNGDGRNETWNIVGFDDQPSAKIYIFDRFGKLLKQISPAGQGWNGTYNGEQMPSSDYWFSVEYVEPSTGQQKQFRSHFTLKR